LTYPLHYSITVLPKLLKEKAEVYIKEYASSMKELGASETTINKIYTIITHMNSADNEKYLNRFKQDMEEKDRFRNENFSQIFLEYKGL
jgi:hypothetical protein